jgi:type I restriction enzyme M protein
MTAEQLRELETDLWELADQLRANSKLTATEYTMPVLGLIFLRQASNRFDQVKAEIEPTLPVRNGKRMPLTKEMFQEKAAIFLPAEAHYDHLVNLPASEDVGAAIDSAMRSIEAEYDQLSGVLPKTYTLFEKKLLNELLRIFNKETLKTATGDVFGKIYEYFLNEFAKKGAQEGGEFFTPMSLVQTIVNFIEPDHGTILDPACGSAGMFVQTGYCIEQLNKNVSRSVTFYGQEKTATNTNIAKMNMAVHGLEGSIMEGNTFYEDKHNLVGKCDFVMANPPFNVDKVDKESDLVKKDPRLPFGLPKSDNANYLWIQYFYSYLNETGRAGFVMASSASDAGHSEKAIREQLVKTGAVDIMVAISNNFFYTRSLPCTLWFYDRAKEKDPVRRDQILMLDARKVFRKVSTTINDFSPEQSQSLKAIVKAYRGDNSLLHQTVESFVNKYRDLIPELGTAFQLFSAQYEKVLSKIRRYPNEDVVKAFNEVIGNVDMDGIEQHIAMVSEVNDIIVSQETGYKGLAGFDKKFAETKTVRKETRRSIDQAFKQLVDAHNEVVKTFELTKVKEWRDEKIKNLIDNLGELSGQLQLVLHDIEYYHHAAEWLFKRFPDGIYVDVKGLCKIVSQNDVERKDYSLSPGRYVDVESFGADDEIDYEEKLEQIHLELDQLNSDAMELAKRIFKNYQEVAG